MRQKFNGLFLLSFIPYVYLKSGIPTVTVWLSAQQLSAMPGSPDSFTAWPASAMNPHLKGNIEYDFTRSDTYTLAVKLCRRVGSCDRSA
jgi:hypothetical protein